GSIAPPSPIDSIPTTPPPPSSATSASRDDDVPNLPAAEPAVVAAVPLESPAPPIAHVPETEPAVVAAPVATVAVAVEPPPPVQDRSGPHLLPGGAILHARA